MKRLILTTLLVLFILTTVAGPFTISSQDVQLHSVNTANAQTDPIGGVDPVTPPPTDPIGGVDPVTPPQPSGPSIPAGPKPEEQTDIPVALNCGLFKGEFIDCIALVVNTIFEFFGWILGGAGVVLDKTVEETVIKMGENVKNVGAIEKGWETFRDLANIVLIFGFLAIGIGTILQLENYGIGKLLPTLIIVALLVNFSFFFTRVIIDGGNLLATRTYEAIQDCGKPEPDACKISNQFMDALKLTSLYKVDINTGEASLPALSPENIITIGIMGTLLFLVTTFVFLAAAFLLAIRFVVLIFLIILAPLAFVAMAIPPLTGQARKWWKLLINYTIFAPIYFFLLFFVLRVVKDFNFGKLDATFAQSVVTDGEVRIESFTLFLNFLIAIIFMVAALFIAKDLGIRGGEAALSAGKKLRLFGQRRLGGVVLGGAGALGRRTVGRGSRALSQNERLKEWESQGGFRGAVAGAGLRGFAYGGKASYDVRAAPGGKETAKALGLGTARGKGGYEDIRKKQVERREEAGKRVGKVRETEQEIVEKETHHQDLTEARDRLAFAKTETERAGARDDIKNIEGRLKIVQAQINRRGELRKERLAQAYTKRTKISTRLGRTGARREGAAKLRAAKTTAVKITEALKADKDLASAVKPETSPETPSDTSGDTPSTN